MWKDTFYAREIEEFCIIRGAERDQSPKLDVLRILEMGPVEMPHPGYSASLGFVVTAQWLVFLEVVQVESFRGTHL